MQKWEYLALDVDVSGHSKLIRFTESGDVIEELKRKNAPYGQRIAQLGNDGWELVSVAQEGYNASYYFKRPKE